MRDVVRRRGIRQPPAQNRHVLRVFQVFRQFVVGRGDEVREGEATVGLAAPQGLGGLAQQVFPELRVAPSAGLDGCV